MSRLRDALLAVQGSAEHLGGTLSDKARTRLQALQRSLELQGWLIFAAVTVGTALAIWAAILNIKNSGLGIPSALGLSVAAALTLLRNTWRELANTNLLLVLLDDANEAQVAALINKLIDKLSA